MLAGRYDQIRAAEDLGGIEMFPDYTDDLVGAQKEDLAPVAPGDEVEVPPIPHKEK